MAWARCTSCAGRTWWDARQGARLRDHPCACGGRLEPATGNVGRRVVTCALCRRLRYHPNHLTREVERAARVWHRGRPPPSMESVEVPAGAVVCSDHPVEPIDLDGGMDGQPVLLSPHPHVAERLAVPGLDAEQTYRAKLRRRGEDLVAVLAMPCFPNLTLRECAWQPVPREEVPTA